MGVACAWSLGESIRMGWVSFILHRRRPPPVNKATLFQKSASWQWGATTSVRSRTEQPLNHIQKNRKTRDTSNRNRSPKGKRCQNVRIGYNCKWHTGIRSFIAVYNNALRYGAVLAFCISQFNLFCSCEICVCVFLCFLYFIFRTPIDDY